MQQIDCCIRALANGQATPAPAYTRVSGLGSPTPSNDRNLWSNYAAVFSVVFSYSVLWRVQKLRSVAHIHMRVYLLPQSTMHYCLCVLVAVDSLCVFGLSDPLPVLFADAKDRSESVHQKAFRQVPMSQCFLLLLSQ